MKLTPRVAVIVSVLTLVASLVGFVVVLVLNAFVLDEFDAYGEVPIPGEASLQLPEGQVTVSFHTMVTGQPSAGFPIPPLSLRIDPPAGVPEPAVTESVSGTTTVNSDTHVRLWVADVPQAGEYRITVDGQVGGYIRPRLAFGADSSHSALLWGFGALFAVGLVELAAALVWSVRAGKRARPLG